MGNSPPVDIGGPKAVSIDGIVESILNNETEFEPGYRRQKLVNGRMCIRGLGTYIHGSQKTGGSIRFDRSLGEQGI